jgi:hypothetical protein
MIQRIRRLGVAQMAKVMGALYFLLGILIAALMGLFGSMFQTAGDESAMLFGGGAFLIALPILYGVIGVVAGALIAWLYNVVAGFTGGLELELEGGEYERA